jgi:hypothetical protein
MAWTGPVKARAQQVNHQESSQMKEGQSNQTVWWERSAIIVLAVVYLIVFNRVTPHGDALRIVRQIQDSHLIWNPNHLIFDPLGYGWYALLGKFGFSISALDSFEIISGITAVTSLLIFHALLLQAGVKSWGVRVLAVGGLFASQGFLSMAISQYYFMVQMPFLLGVLYFAMRFFSKEKSGEDRALCLYGMGVLAGVAGTIMFNNVLLVVALGLAVGFTRHDRVSWNYIGAARLWGAAAVVGFPVFIFGYVASGSSDGFLHWLLSYQGESESSLNELYGIEWTLKGVAVSLARAGFNLFSASIIETAGLGTTIKAILFREPLEFVPETEKLLLALSLTPVIAGTLLVLLVWGARRIRQDRVVQFAFAWIGAFFVFNTLWSCSGDLFWFQILPVLWILLMTYLGAVSGVPFEGVNENWGQRRWKFWTLALTVPALLIVNTLQTVVPVSLVDLDARRAEHMALLRDGDVEIIPGWDGYGWMQLDPKGPRVERIALMDMALQAKTSDRHIQQLPLIVADHIAHGKRVVVARLYDKDHGLNPWYGLTRLGWSRARIQALLSSYCQREIGKVGDVVFREVFTCQ